MALSYCQRNTLPKVFKRFVDNIFVMFTNESIRFLSTRHVDVRLGSKYVSEFTSIFEENSSCAFLEI